MSKDLKTTVVEAFGCKNDYVAVKAMSSSKGEKKRRVRSCVVCSSLNVVVRVRSRRSTECSRYEDLWVTGHCDKIRKKQ